MKRLEYQAIITDSEKDIKMLLKGPVLMPDVAIIDYTFTLTSPKSVSPQTLKLQKPSLQLNKGS